MPELGFNIFMSSLHCVINVHYWYKLTPMEKTQFLQYFYQGPFFIFSNLLNSHLSQKFFFFTDILSSSNNHKETSIEKIPVRATFFSAFSAIPYILILFMLNSSGFDNRSLGISSRLVNLLLGAIRCPTIGFKKLCTKSLIQI